MEAAGDAGEAGSGGDWRSEEAGSGLTPYGYTAAPGEASHPP
jgi:hypothetical protein